MEELRKEGRGESQKEGSPAQRPTEGEEGKGRERVGEAARREKEGAATCPRGDLLDGSKDPRGGGGGGGRASPPSPPPTIRQQEAEMKEISSGVWPGGQWTRQPLKFFHFSGNRI